MKELSIEEKAKAYDKVREKIKVRFGTNVAEEIFSEFEESEDEKIRKKIIALFKGQIPYTSKEDNEKFIAWLEKQKTSEEALQYLKENHSPSEVSDFQAAMNIAVAKAYDKGIKDGLEKQGEKPIGISSGHATGKLGEIIKEIEAEPFDKYEGLTDFERTLADVCRGWIGEELGWKDYIIKNSLPLLELAKKQFDEYEQKPTDEEMKELLQTEYEKGRADAIAEMQVAWSEEDEMIALSIEQVINCASLLNIVPEKIDKIRTWLKSLKQRI